MPALLAEADHNISYLNTTKYRAILYDGDITHTTIIFRGPSAAALQDHCRIQRVYESVRASAHLPTITGDSSCSPGALAVLFVLNLLVTDWSVIGREHRLALYELVP